MCGSSALVLFSGGQDSTVCLAWALSRYGYVETIGFDYGQKHRVELDCRPQIIDELRRRFPNWSKRLGPDRVLPLDLSHVESALTEYSLPRTDGLPATFVPGRNLLFFTLAGAIANAKGMKFLVGGMCETDFSGYPDCRDDTLKALQVVLNLGLLNRTESEKRMVIETPLMWLTKAETWDLTQLLGGLSLVNLIVDETHTCYRGDRSQRHRWGYGCGDCDACRLRAHGWTTFDNKTIYLKEDR